jgi:hypothetical protein
MAKETRSFISGMKSMTDTRQERAAQGPSFHSVRHVYKPHPRSDGSRRLTSTRRSMDGLSLWRGDKQTRGNRQSAVRPAQRMTQHAQHHTTATVPALSHAGAVKRHPCRDDNSPTWQSRTRATRPQTLLASVPRQTFTNCRLHPLTNWPLAPRPRPSPHPMALVEADRRVPAARGRETPGFRI